MAIFLSLLIVFWLTGLYFFAGKRKHYVSWRDTISELAETGSEFESQVSYLFFLPFGLGCTALAFFSFGSFSHASILVAAMGLAYTLSAIFPCDPGTPLIGSTKNTVHNLIGAFAYATVVYQLNDLKDIYPNLLFQLTFFLMSIFLLCFVLSWPKQYIGLLQRAAEFSVLLCILSLLVA